jgi:hypothetical protein
MEGRWSIERRVRGGRTEFHFVRGGDLGDLKLLESLVRREFGAGVKRRLNGPCGEALLRLGLADHDIEFCFDGGYETIYFSPVNERDVELTQAFAGELRKKLDGHLRARGGKG